MRAYLASISFMDSQVGRVLDALQDAGRGNETIVVLWSDHGWHLGEKGITGKNSLWERSTRVPLIFAGPGIVAGATCSRPAELLDIYPTLVELCGLPQRRPRRPQPGPPAQGRECTSPLAGHHHPQRGNHAVRSERWRYIRYADGSEELYDHETDPNEWTNRGRRSRDGEYQARPSRWLPAHEEPPAPGSATRFLDRRQGLWYWEGEPIVPDVSRP